MKTKQCIWRWACLPLLAWVGWGGVGCAHYRPAPLTSQRAATEFQDRTLADAGLRAFLETNSPAALPAWPLPQWDLNQLTLAAFYFHPDLEVARARWAVAKAGQITAGQRPNPSLGVAPGYNTTEAMPTPWFLTATADVPLETAGKRGYRQDQARHLADAARWDIRAVAWQVRRRLRQQLVEWQAARASAAVLRQQEAMREQALRLLEGQRDAGAVSGLEVTRARIALDQVRLARHDLERRQAEARTRLAAAIGVPTRAIAGIEFSNAGLDAVPAELDPATVRREALFHRSDIRAALAEYAAAESALQLEIAKQYPDVHLNPGYEYDQGLNKWSLGLTVTLPVFNQNQGGIAEAEARRAEVAARFNALQARVLAELDRTLAAFQAVQSKLATADQLLARQRQQVEVAQARLAAGDVSRLDVLQAQLEANQGGLDRLTALAEARQALGDLETAAQRPGPWPGQVTQMHSRTSATRSAVQ